LERNEIRFLKIGQVQSHVKVIVMRYLLAVAVRAKQRAAIEAPSQTGMIEDRLDELGEFEPGSAIDVATDAQGLVCGNDHYSKANILWRSRRSFRMTIAAMVIARRFNFRGRVHRRAELGEDEMTLLL